jgi:hypothetical protein
VRLLLKKSNEKISPWSLVCTLNKSKKDPIGCVKGRSDWAKRVRETTRKKKHFNWPEDLSVKKKH